MEPTWQIIQALYTNIPYLIPALITVAVIWGLVGWFYVHLLGKELHDFVVLSILALIVILSFVVLFNRDAQMLLFGNY